MTQYIPLIINNSRDQNINSKLYKFYVKKYAEYIDYMHHVKITGQFHIGIAVVYHEGEKEKYQIQDNLEIFSQNLSKLVLKITNKCSSLIKYNFPQLTKLRLESDKPIFLNRWNMPLLKYLDVTQCKKCVFDGCELPGLVNLYVDFLSSPVLRFGHLSMMTNMIIVDQTKKCIALNINVKKAIEIERQYVQDAKIYKWCQYIETNDVNCGRCRNPVIILGDQVTCSHCRRSQHLDYQEFRELHKIPNCLQCHNDLTVFIDKYGYVNGYCDACNSVFIYGRKYAFATGIIEGHIKYPVM